LVNRLNPSLVLCDLKGASKMTAEIRAEIVRLEKTPVKTPQEFEAREKLIRDLIAKL